MPTILSQIYRFLIISVLRLWIPFKFWLLQPYFVGIGVQARFLYKRSELFRLRYEALGLEYAESSFKGSTAEHFFAEARKCHLRIRLQIFIDAMLGRTPRPYYVSEEEGGGT